MGYRVEIYTDNAFRQFPLTRQGLPSISWRVEGEVPFSVQASEATFDVLYEQSGLETIRKGSWGRILWDDVPIYYGILSDELLVSPRQGVISVRLVSPLAEMKRFMLGRRFGNEKLYRYRRQETDELGVEWEYIALPAMYEEVFHEVEKLRWEKVFLFSTPRGGFTDMYERDAGYDESEKGQIEGGETYVFQRPLSRPVTAPASIQEVIREIAEQVGKEFDYTVEADLTGFVPIRHSLRARLLDQPFDDLAFYTYQGQVQMIGMTRTREVQYQMMGDFTLYVARTEVDLQQASQAEGVVGVLNLDYFLQVAGIRIEGLVQSPVRVVDSCVWSGFISRFTYASLVSAVFRYVIQSPEGFGGVERFRRAYAVSATQYDHSTASWVNYGSSQIVIESEVDYKIEVYRSVLWGRNRLEVSTDEPILYVSDDPRYLRIRGGDQYIPFFQGSVFLSHITIDGTNLEAGSVLRDICAFSNSIISVEGVGVDEVMIRIASRDWGGLLSGYMFPEPISWRYRISDMRFSDTPTLSVGIMENESVSLSLKEFYRSQFSRVYYYVEMDFLLTQFQLASVRYLKPLYRWSLPQSVIDVLGCPYGMVWGVDIRGDSVSVEVRCEQPIRGLRIVD